jgi:hypothetical protein
VPEHAFRHILEWGHSSFPDERGQARSATVDAAALRAPFSGRMEIGEITDGAASAPFSGVARERLTMA